MPKKLLIIEDEKILLDMYLERFARQDIEVLSAESAEDGLDIAKKQMPDLILLDILLPRDNGIEFLEELRKNPETSELKVLVFSNYDEPQTKKMAKQLGSLDYLIKTDFTPSQISKKVQKILNEPQ